MKKVDKYCDKIQKQSEKLLCKLFGKASMSVFIKHRNLMRLRIESIVGHGINRITEDDIKMYHIGYEYACYKTLDNVIETYLKSVELKNFIIKELKEYRQ